MKPSSLFAGVAALLAMVAAFWFFGGDSDSAPPRVEAAGNELRQTDEEVQSAIERQELPAPSEAAAPMSPAPAPAPPTRWLARFLVVDLDDAPVADAIVTLWSGTRDGDKHDLLHELRTGPAGRTEVLLGSEIEILLAAARKDGVGETGRHGMRGGTATERKLQLTAPAPLRGIVLSEDGIPVAGAAVSAEMEQQDRPDRVEAPGPVITGADGRFEVPLQPLVTYALQAAIDHRTSSTCAVFFVNRPLDVTLRFPARSVLSGLVVDAEGRPVAQAEVVLWRQHPNGPTLPRDAGPEYWNASTTLTGDDGRFSIAMRDHARHSVFAKKGRRYSKSLLAETSVVRPEAELRLELLRPATILGRVVRADGSPCEDALVGADPDDGDVGAADIQRLMRTHARLPVVDSVRTDAAGAFELEVHPEHTWTVFVRPKADHTLFEFTRSGVRPGDAGVDVVVSEPSGCVVRGTVTRADGKPMGKYHVRVIQYASGRRPNRGEGGATLEGNQFTCRTVWLGREYAIAVMPSREPTLAPTLSRRFVADRAEMQVDVRLEPCGEVPVHVLDASGAPARRVLLRLSSDAGLGGVEPRSLVGADGRLLLKPGALGAHTLSVSGDAGLLHEVPVMVTSGVNREVVVQLPPAK